MVNPGIGLKWVTRHPSLVTLLTFFCLLLPAHVFSQTANRWLFVFNTSSAMRDRTKGTENVVADLFSTAMHGNLRGGDTIGIWTYNDKLRADEAPLLTWDPNTAPAMAQNAVTFLSRHPYSGSAAFDNVLTNMLRVIKMSDVITVVLVSDGSDRFTGTPFDSSIAAFYKTNYQAQRKAHMPIITVLRGEGGTITTNTVSLAPWPVDIPAVPLPKPVEPKVEVAKPKPPPVPSLVIIGKKAENTFNPPSDSSLEETNAAIAAQKAAQAKTETPPPAPEPAPVTKAEEKPKETPTAVAPVVTNPPAPLANTPQPAPPAEIATPAAPATNEAVVKPATPAIPPPVETATSTPQKSLFSTRNIAVASVAFTVIVCGLLIMAARNARRASRASLITRSLDREGK